MAEEFISRVRQTDLGRAIMKGRESAACISTKELQKTPRCGLISDQFSSEGSTFSC